MLEPHLVPDEDAVRAPVPGPPPLAGAQWDEIHGCWERWDELDGRWHVVAVHHGDHDEAPDDDWVRPPAILGSAPPPVPVIDLRDRRIDTETSLREFLVEARH
jgi:hypothetical protein